MFEVIDTFDMKEGEMYFVKKYDYIIGKIKFIKYEKENENWKYLGHFAVFDVPIIGTHHSVVSLCIYRYISKEEYYEKVKEKYNQTCLDIVLKRLVDESFQW